MSKPSILIQHATINIGDLPTSNLSSLVLGEPSKIEVVGRVLSSDAFLKPDPNRYSTDLSTGIVHDPLTGLDWSQEELPEAEWEQSAAACRDYRLGGFTDWRMPTDRELLTIVDRQRYNPCLPPIFKTEGESVWTSTQTAWSKDKAASARSFFCVLMSLGGVYDGYADYRLRGAAGAAWCAGQSVIVPLS